MESRTFIKEAAALTRDITNFQLVQFARTHEEGAGEAKVLQKRADTLFAGLQNPTLLAAANLADRVQAAGFTIAPAVRQKLRDGERLWGN